MRAWMLGLAIFSVPTFALAQSAKNSPPPKANLRLDELLNAWASKSAATKDMHCEFERISKDAVFGTETVETGKASGVKPYLGRLDLFDEKGNWSQVFIYNGRALYQYEFKKKQQITHALPEPGPDANKTIPGPLSFVYGMSSTEAKARFDLALAKEFSKGGADYAQIQVSPRLPADQLEFKSATLVIDKKTFLPKQLRIMEPNGNQQDWIFNSVETNLNIPSASFGPLKNLPKDWEKITNDYGKQPAKEATPKTRGPEAPKSRPEAGRPALPKK